MPKRTEPLASSAAPPNAIPIWTDGLSLFTELPRADGSPFPIRYPLTITGLSSALDLVRTHAFDCLDRQPPAGQLPTHRTKLDQALAARETLRKLGVIP